MNLSLYNLWDDMGIGGRNTMLVLGSGLRYGITDVVNPGLMLWSSVFDIGASPSLHFQLIDSRQRLNLGLIGNVSTTMFDGNNNIEIWGMPELTWGPNKFIYFGFRYEHRWKICRINNTDRRYSRTRGDFYDSISTVPLLCAFFGTENKPRQFRKVTPYIMVHFDISNGIWQVTGGTTYHFILKTKK